MESGTKPIRNDLSKGKMIISEESCRAVYEMGSMELIEPRQTSATTQCPSCLKDIPEGLNMCLCGVCLRPNQSTMDRIRTAFAALQTPHYRASVTISRGKKSGHNPWQMDHQKAMDAKWQKDQVYRASQLVHGWTGDVRQVLRLHLQDWHQSWCTLPTTITIWKHNLYEKRRFQCTSRTTVSATLLLMISRCFCQHSTSSRQRSISYSTVFADKTE